MSDLDTGRFRIARGRLMLIPICNPRAHEEDKRYIERNLNRYLVPMETPDSYEAGLANILCRYFVACDALLDLHSYTIGGAPFISYRGETSEERAFAASLGVRDLLTGWETVYAKMGRGRLTSPDEATGGPEYARRHGAVAVTLECGQHKDPRAAEVAYQGILNALQHFNMVGGEGCKPAEAPPPRHIEMTHVFYRDEGGELAKNWKNFEPLKKGEVVAKYPDGKSIVAPFDCYVVMPKENCPVGEEWFYFGVEAPV
jgi:predicted deacylase